MRYIQHKREVLDLRGKGVNHRTIGQQFYSDNTNIWKHENEQEYYSKGLGGEL
jgi:hypothetical protein